MGLALVAGCSGGEGNGDAADEPRDPARSSPSAEVTRVVDGFLEADLTGTYDDVRAILVLQDGQPVLERYYQGSGKDSGDVASVTTSVLSLLVGIAIDEGTLIGVDQTLEELLPDQVDQMTATIRGITLHQVLTMTAGFPADAYNAPAHTAARDWVATILSDRLAQPPGQGFAYASVGSHLLSAILVEATGRSVLDYAREKVFDPLGVDTTPAAEPVFAVENLPEYEAAGFAWPVDPQGIHIGWGSLKLSAPDMAKLGMLMLQEGNWDGRQVVSRQWVAAATSAHVRTGGHHATPAYGYQWWVTTADGHPAYAALGFGGQLIEVVPDLDLVVVVACTIPEVTRIAAPAFLTLVDTAIAPALGS